MNLQNLVRRARRPRPLPPRESLLVWLVIALVIFFIAGLFTGLLYAGWHQSWPEIVAAFGSLFV